MERMRMLHCVFLIFRYIDHNEITTIRRTTFENLGNMELLSLRNNKIDNIEENAFHNLVNLKELNIEAIEITNIHTSMFSTLKNLESIHFKRYSYCHYVGSETRCRPLSDGISSNNQLLYKPLFRYTNWLICFSTCSGNILVLFGRFLFRDENKVLSLIIKNLAVSDFLMGIYLLLIGIQDMRYRNIYFLEAQNWISSWGCTVVGMFAMVSSEVSVLLLVFMSVDRFFLIAVPFGRYSSVTMRETTFVLLFIWGFGILLAIFPALEYMSTTRFYGVNGLCFPFHIDDPYGIGWEYSAIIFFAINGTGLFIIAFVYAAMFISIYRTRNATTLQTKDYEFAIRFFFIVLTDVTCWLPIITVKAAAMMGAQISADLYGWLVVFILPINSALNPILYTFTTPKYRTQIIKTFPSLIKEAANFTKNNGNTFLSLNAKDLKLKCDNGEKLQENNVKLVVNKF
ncbi:hypothetical protein NQ317_010598 [Molorchus minor]|uniref:G-protein coupled receptors family 1 profile domain-containing protein n=1 Tax=Molorchus minor TaxID=1323400 RepID=A0ABQ9JQY2_9CUCU|nr:hypothetical protein NQ317_010598 [Molorchus minor]